MKYWCLKGIEFFSKKKCEKVWQIESSQGFFLL